MLFKIKRYLEVMSGNFLFDLGIPRKSIFLVSLAIYLTSRKINNVKGAPTVMCLERSIFIDDINAMSLHSGRINYLVFSRKCLLRIFHSFVGSDTQLSDHNYYKLAQKEQPELTRYRIFLKSCFEKVCRWLNIKGMMSGNFVYAREQELIKACRELGIPFIVYFKEGITSPEKYDDLMELYKDNEFHASMVLMYNRKIHEATIKLHIGVTENNSSVIGVARFDDLFSDESCLVEEKTIVLFSFVKHEKFYHLQLSDKQRERAYSWVDGFQKKLISFVGDNHEYTLIIKTKNAEHYVEYVKDLVLGCLGCIPSNIVLDNKSHIPELISKAKIVAGFNSITLLESLVKGKQLLMPDFDGIVERKDWDYFLGYDSGAEYIRPESDVEEVINRLVSKDSCNSGDNVKRILDDYANNSDGKASIRAENEILRIIDNYERFK